MPPAGQQWTTSADLARDHHDELRELEPGLLGIGVEPDLGIGQRALLVSTPRGNVLWDAVPVLDDDARDAIEARGGVDVICVSHPHVHTTVVDLAETLDSAVLDHDAAAVVQRLAERHVARLRGERPA